VNADDKKCARLNVIRHLLALVPYEDLTPPSIKLPPLDRRKYARPPLSDQNFVPEYIDQTPPGNIRPCAPGL
jgi:polyphosphate kinase